MATGKKRTRTDADSIRPPIVSKETVFKTVFWSGLTLLACGFGALLLFSYKDYVDPKHVHGSWIEIGAPSYQTEVLTFDERGVFRNNRLVSTNFDYNGKNIEVETGLGITIYQVTGTMKSPQLKRIEPSSPIQRFVKQGYEDTITDSEGNAGQTRRAALSAHFND